MQRSSRYHAVTVVSILFVAVPFAFGLIRAIITRHDLRYLWMAVVAFLGAAVVITIGRARSRQPGAVALSATALLVDTLLTGAAGYMLGARSTVGVWLVAFCFALCCVTGVALNTRWK